MILVKIYYKYIIKNYWQLSKSSRPNNTTLRIINIKYLYLKTITISKSL